MATPTKPATKSKETPEQAVARATNCYKEVDALLKKHRCAIKPKPLFDEKRNIDHIEIMIVPLALE